MAARACGVTAQADGVALAFRAPVVIAVSGGVGPPGHDDRYLDIVLGLRHLADDRTPLPGYGWIFGLGDGRVNVGLAVHDSVAGSATATTARS